MARHIIFVILFELVHLITYSCFAQGEQNIWMVNANPRGGTYNAIDFNSGAPQQINYAFAPYNFPAGFRASNAVCDASGQPLFYTDGQTLYNRYGQKMPNGSGLIYPTAGTGYSVPPIIAPINKQATQYAIITQRNGGLYYTVIDMQAAAGMGDVVPDQKNIPLNAFAGRAGIATDSKLTLAPGCNNTWLVSRSQYANQFRAYKITSQGIVETPVISEVGLLPPEFYPGYNFPGLLKTSPDGRKLVAACGLQGPQTVRPIGTGAIELYDFDRCSGRITNPQIIDSGTHYYGVCFSPDNTKLYASTIEWPDAGRIYQFDLSLPTLAAITASKTHVFTNPTYWRPNPIGPWIPQVDMLGDLKIGPDGKIYASNCYHQPVNCHIGPSFQTPRYTGGYHAINNPNLPGLACNPAANVIWTNSWMGIDMPPDILLSPQQDTTYGRVRQITACFRDSITLQADTPGRCYIWDDGSDQPARSVTRPGLYTVQYTDDHCTLHIDIFDVGFVQSPYPAPATYSCPNTPKGHITILPATNDRTLFQYRWSDASGNRLGERTRDQGDTLTGISAGNYSVRITTASGCDTTLYAEVLPLPLPIASFEADTVICKGDSLIFIYTSDAPAWQWHFGDGATTKDRNPHHVYPSAGRYETWLIAENVEGCRDTARKSIQVKQLHLQLTASPTLLNRGETVLLHTTSPEPYRVTAWLPEAFFTDQSAYHQQAIIDTTRNFTVTGHSTDGCIDTASVLVTTHPLLYLPTAFTPNGDGRNDYFRPSVSGPSVTIHAFHIYDRWGRAIWSGQGSSDAVGWDGTYNGTPAEVGAYYYTIEAETHTGKTIRQKGDLTLVR